MAYIKSKHGLMLPEKTGNLSKKRDLSPQAIEKWRSQLPLSDLSGSAKALYLMLQDIHQISLSPKARLEMLSLLRPTLSTLSEALQKLYYPEALTEYQRSIADLVYALHAQMLNGYKIAIDEGLSSFFISQKVMLAAFQNAMHYSVKILLHAYKQHRQPPPGAWLELHTLFSLASKKNLANKKLTLNLEWNSRLNTLQDIYKQALLFVLANPERLRHDQMHHLHYALETWAPLLSFTKTQKPDALFFVDLLSDHGPQYTALNFSPSTENQFLILKKIEERIIKLRDALSNASSGVENKSVFTDAEKSLSPLFLDSLLSAWTHIGERTHKRHIMQGNICVCLGIASSCWYIQQNIFPTQDVSSEHKSESENTQKVVHYYCTIVDQSTGGYCLKWSGEIPRQLQCGEIIALGTELEDNQKTWVIGIIRWLRKEKDNATYFGVQILSMEAIAVMAHLIDSSIPSSVSTLLIADSTEAKTPMKLITPFFPFKAGQHIQLEYEHKNYAVTLEKGTTVSPHYQEFNLDFGFESIAFPHRITPAATTHISSSDKRPPM